MRSVVAAHNHGAKFDVTLIGSDQAESMLIRLCDLASPFVFWCFFFNSHPHKTS